jgi:hypothetical protein
MLQAFGLLDLQASILTPAEVALLRDGDVLAGERDAQALGELHLDLAQLRDDLLRAEPLLRHGGSTGQVDSQSTRSNLTQLG